ncbi:rhodanese-like domain-containing protein [Methylobacter psychrophilus]|uniref:rhodanese-like domain-containing protein n=1 Tax=Methylobacter psychrophilus TaxID=96941 RepID=UPI0021D5131E|nr:rhodanese-like domain-containing protein [Methylobacter psychrophilus]
MMKKMYRILIVLCLFATNGALAGNSLLKETDIEAVALKVATETVQGGYKLLSVAELKQMIDGKENFVLIDAHPTEEYNLAYIDGARHFGFQSNHSGNWEKDIAMPDSFTQEDYRVLLGADKNKKIVTYCGLTKCGRSHNAASWAKKLGYTNVYRAPGGISAWIDSGYSYKTNLNK